MSMFTPSSASTANTLAATPGCERMPAPTIETLPISSWAVRSTKASPCSGSSATRATRRSSRGIVKEISARPPAETGSFWTIMSTFTFACASASKMRAAAPGASGTPTSVIRASAVECVTAVISGCSMFSPSASTTVPGSSSNEERQWMRTPWLRAYSTERSCSTPAPEAAISSISSKETVFSLRASGTIRGSAV